MIAQNAFMWPHFSPVLVRFGPFAIHYYALAYIVALLIGWRLVRHTAQLPPVAASDLQVDDFLGWATLGIILGGRLGYVCFYQPGYFFTHPAKIIAVWDGGMSFHGGFLGVLTAIIWFCLKHHLSILRFGDRIVIAVPIGLFLGRIANFINGELWGRPAAPWFPWPVIYPQSGTLDPRYPSELIEAALEGIVLFFVMLTASRFYAIRTATGMLSGMFITGYGIARIIGECFREPDAFMGFLPFGTTEGQWLSVPMVLAGIGMMVWAASTRRADGGLPASP